MTKHMNPRESGLNVSRIAGWKGAMAFGLAGAVIWAGGMVSWAAGDGADTSAGKAGHADAKGGASAVGGAKAPVKVAGVSGLWVWSKKSVETPQARQALIEFAGKHGFNRLFVQVRYEPGSVKAGKPVVADVEIWKDLAATAGAKGIKIEALDGGPEMARAGNAPSTLAQLGAIIRMSNSLGEGSRLAGVHYDIEPYTSTAWKKPEERPLVMKEFLDFFHAARGLMAKDAPGMTLGADIPFWYDNKTQEGDTCVLEYAGETKNFHMHIQDVTDYVGVMSYRRKAAGPNSVTAVVENELAYAQKIGKTVCPALETGVLKDTPTITFDGLPKEEFWAVKKQVEEGLKANPGYGGLLVHSYENLKKYLGE